MTCVVTLCVCLCVSRERDDSALRLPSLKHSFSQNSCDTVVMDTSTVDDRLSLDSDTSENFIIFTDSGMTSSPR